MRTQLKDLIFPLIITLVLLFVLNIFSTTILPVLGISSYIIPFNILLVLYLGFKLESIWLPVLILIVQYFFSFFSVEGWELGTIAGIFICFLISYLRDLIHLNSVPMTVLITQIFQVVWFVIVSSLIYLKTGELAYIIERFWRFVPESIVISLMAPFIFMFLDKFWRQKQGAVLGDDA